MNSQAFAVVRRCYDHLPQKMPPSPSVSDSVGIISGGREVGQVSDGFTEEQLLAAVSDKSEVNRSSVWLPELLRAGRICDAFHIPNRLPEDLNLIGGDRL